MSSNTPDVASAVYTSRKFWSSSISSAWLSRARRKPGQMSLLDNISFYRYVGKDRIHPGDDRDCSTDEDPYSCLTLGELASLGGFADEQVLNSKFKPIPHPDNEFRWP